MVLDKKDGNAKLVSYDKQHCIHIGRAAVVFDGRIYSPTLNASGAKTIAKKLEQADGLGVSEAFLKQVEGDFSLLIAEPERIIAGRDSVGVAPLYYGENGSVAALASNRRALWKLGINAARSFPPGHLAIISRKGFKFRPVKTLAYAQPKPVAMQEAAETLQKLLEKSVRARVGGAQEIAVAFSGGLDSSVVAFLAEKCHVDVRLIHVSLENQPETEAAKKAAEELNLPLQVHLFRESDVANVVASVVELIEEPDPIKTSIGVPFYWTAKKVAEAEIMVLLAGQGADELFGGYQRYVNEYLLHGKDSVRKTMFDDVVCVYESNLERDVKICSFHNVELRLPYTSYQLAEFALSLPTELKIERDIGALRKLVLRQAAQKMGLPASITKRPKKAIQYSTGINRALKKLAKKQGTTIADYVNGLFLSQKMGC